MRSAVAGMAALALLAGGCSAGDGADGGEESLEDFMFGGVDTDDPDAMQAQFEDQQRQLEEHIAECMADEGFEYEPRDTSMSDAPTHPSQDMEPDEFAEEYGYGLSTLDAEDQGLTEPVEDPNQERLQEMDEAERQAYQEALHGEMPEPDPDADPEEPTEVEIGGCQGEAQEAVQGQQQQVQQELGDELQAHFQQVENDPRILEAQEGWSDCMADAGWEFEEPQESLQHIMEQHNELQQAAAPSEPAPAPDGDAADEGGEADATAGDEAAVDEPGAGGDVEVTQPPEPDPEALEELQQEELELAPIDHECQVEHFGEEQELYAEVMEEYEQDFVDEHRDTLEELSED